MVFISLWRGTLWMTFLLDLDIVGLSAFPRYTLIAWSYRAIHLTNTFQYIPDRRPPNLPITSSTATQRYSIYCLPRLPIPTETRNPSHSLAFKHCSLNIFKTSLLYPMLLYATIKIYFQNEPPILSSSMQL